MSPHLVLVCWLNTQQNNFQRWKLLTEEAAQLIPFEIEGNLRDKGNIFAFITTETEILVETGSAIDHNIFSGHPLVIKNAFSKIIYLEIMTHFRSGVTSGDRAE